MIVLFFIILCYVPSMVSASTFKATGYYPFTCTAAERAIEGGKNDRFGNRLRTLQDYYEGSYVSVATDPKIIKSGTVLEIKEFPNIRFLACDVGRAIKGKKIDICVRHRKDAHALPRKITVKKVADENNRDTIKFWKQIFTAFKDEIQKLERCYFDSQNNTRLCLVRSDTVSSESTMATPCVRYREARLSRFRHR